MNYNQNPSCIKVDLMKLEKTQFIKEGVFVRSKALESFEPLERYKWIKLLKFCRLFYLSEHI